MKEDWIKLSYFVISWLEYFILKNHNFNENLINIFMSFFELGKNDPQILWEKLRNVKKYNEERHTSVLLKLIIKVKYLKQCSIGPRVIR